VIADDAKSAAVGAALTVHPLDHNMLRRSVWVFVGARRHAGAPPGPIIMALTDLVNASHVEPLAARQELLRRVILWCVEAYFGHLNGDVAGLNGDALGDAPPIAP